MDTLKYILNPFARDCYYYQIEIPADALLSYNKGIDASPNSIIASIMYKVCTRLFTPKDGPHLAARIPADFRDDIGCPDSYRDFVRYIHVKYTAFARGIIFLNGLDEIGHVKMLGQFLNRICLEGPVLGNCFFKIVIDVVEDNTIKACQKSRTHVCLRAVTKEIHDRGRADLVHKSLIDNSIVSALTQGLLTTVHGCFTHAALIHEAVARAIDQHEAKVREIERSVGAAARGPGEGRRCLEVGGALYGTNSIDEELSLEKLLGMSRAGSRESLK